MNRKPRWNPAALVVLMTVFGTGCPDQGAQKTAPPPTTTAPAPNTTTAPAPLVAPRQAADWCAEHVVPESICTRCNASLIDGFKAKNDWCNEHSLPESQCLTCHPDLKAKFEAMAPKQ